MTPSKFVIVARSCDTATTAPRPSFFTACIHRDRHDVGRNCREREEAGKQERLQACKEEVAALCKFHTPHLALHSTTNTMIGNTVRGH